MTSGSKPADGKLTDFRGPMSVPCPICGACVGAPCMGATLDGVHVARRRRARLEAEKR